MDDGKDTKIPLDTIKPEGNLLIDDGKKFIRSTKVSISVTGTDDIGITGYFLSENSNSPVINHSGWISTKPMPRLVLGNLKYDFSSGDGEKKLYLWLKDASGKISDKFSASTFLDSNPPTISINQPSVSETTYGPVSFQIEYQGADNITLKTSDIIIDANETLKIGAIDVTGSGKENRTVMISNFTGYGQVRIQIAAGSAYDNSNLFSAQSAKSLPVIVKAPDSDIVRPTPSGWPMKHGTEGEDKANAVATDSVGNVYVVGYTEGRLNGETFFGSQDAFLIKYNPDGKTLWTKLIGSSLGDKANAVKVNLSGHVFVAGSTDGSLDGNTNMGRTDIFVAKFDSEGNKKWIRQYGSTEEDTAIGLDTDPPGNVYVTGNTRGDLDGNINLSNGDVFVSKFNTDVLTVD